MPIISPHAIVEEGAELAEGVRVGSFSYIGPKVSIGPGCIIENNVTIVGATTLGELNHVFPMAAIGLSPDGCEGDGVCVTGDANSFREHVTVYAGVDGPTRIGADNLFMIDCTVGAAATVGDHCIFANLTHIGAGAHVADYIHTSGVATIEDGVTVGAYTFIAGYAGIDRDVPPYAMVQGSPHRIRGVNTHKLKRCGFGDDDIRALKEAFRELFNGTGQPVRPEAIQRCRQASGAGACVGRLLEALEAAGAKGGG